MLTDGFHESLCDKKILGMNRVLDTVRQVRDRPAAEILESLRRLACEHAAGEDHQDDMTGVIIKREPVG